MSTLAETTLIMKRLSSAYGQPVDVDRARAYHQVLGQYPRMVLAEAATISLSRGSQFLPKPIEPVPAITLIPGMPASAPASAFSLSLPAANGMSPNADLIAGSMSASPLSLSPYAAQAAKIYVMSRREIRASAQQPSRPSASTRVTPSVPH